MTRIVNSPVQVLPTAGPCFAQSMSPSVDDDCLSNNSTAFPFGASSSSASSDGETARIVPRGAPKTARGEVQPQKFKTQLCAHFVRGEPCPYDPWCAFAHGESELRSVVGNVMEGVMAVNTLPRTLVYHESWVQTTKYVRKTGPATTKPSVAVAPPAPSFMRTKPSASTQAPAPAAKALDSVILNVPCKTFRRNDPYSFRVLM